MSGCVGAGQFAIAMIRSIQVHAQCPLIEANAGRNQGKEGEYEENLLVMVIVLRLVLP